MKTLFYTAGKVTANFSLPLSQSPIEVSLADDGGGVNTTSASLNTSGQTQFVLPTGAITARIFMSDEEFDAGDPVDASKEVLIAEITASTQRQLYDPTVAFLLALWAVAGGFFRIVTAHITAVTAYITPTLAYAFDSVTVFGKVVEVEAAGLFASIEAPPMSPNIAVISSNPLLVVPNVTQIYKCPAPRAAGAAVDPADILIFEQEDSAADFQIVNAAIPYDQSYPYIRVVCSNQTNVAYMLYTINR